MAKILKKLSIVVLCTFMMSLSLFAGKNTTVNLQVPFSSETRYFDIKKKNYVISGAKSLTIDMNPSNNKTITISKVSQYSMIVQSKKNRPYEDFKGYGQWNWIFDNNYNEIRQGLDSDGKTVLCEEKNGVVTSSSVKTHGNTTCTRG